MRLYGSNANQSKSARRWAHANRPIGGFEAASHRVPTGEPAPMLAERPSLVVVVSLRQLHPSLARR